MKYLWEGLNLQLREKETLSIIFYTSAHLAGTKIYAWCTVHYFHKSVELMHKQVNTWINKLRMIHIVSKIIYQDHIIGSCNFLGAGNSPTLLKRKPGSTSVEIFASTTGMWEVFHLKKTIIKLNNPTTMEYRLF